MRLRVTVAAVLGVAALVGSGCGSGSDDSSGQNRKALLSAVSGVPQNANVLGDKDAPYTFGMYVSPISYQMANAVLPQLPQLIRTKVKSGQINVKIRVLGGTPVGDDGDSLQASHLITAAGLQSKFWPTFISMAYSYNGSLDEFSEQDILKDGGVKNVKLALSDFDDPRVVKSVTRNASIASLAGSKNYRDTYIVANKAGVQVDVTSDVQAGKLLSAIANAEKIISG